MDTILNNKKILIIGGCELYFFCKYFEKNKINLNIIYSYYRKTAQDPYEEILKNDSLINEDKYDYIIISQIFSLRKYLINIHGTNKAPNNYENIINDMQDKLTIIIEKIKDIQKCPIFIPTYPYSKLNIYGLFDYKYNSTDLLIRNYNNMILNFCKLNNVFLLDIHDYINNITDTLRPESLGGHLTEKGGEIVGKYFINLTKALNNDNKIKLICYDLDNTIWTGIIRENGIDNIKIRMDYIDILYTYSLRGIILCAISKNDPELLNDITKKILVRCIGFLKNTYKFVLNWKPKSENIKNICKELNISSNSVLFIDDMEYEREEVKFNLPEVLTFKDSEIYDISEHPRMAFLNLNEESKNRIKIYKDNINRNKNYSENIIKFKSLDDYLLTLNMEINILLANMSDLLRIEELLTRTNQQNITMKRLESNEIKKYIDDKNAFIIKLKDKFGDYGIIGTILINNNSNNINIYEIALSCKAMGKNIEENAILSLIYELHNKYNIDIFNINIIETSQNINFINRLINIGFMRNDNVIEYTIDKNKTTNTEKFLKINIAI